VSRFTLAEDEFLVLSYPLDDTVVVPPTLTNAERAVAAALVRGMSMRDIARARRTSPRTIANQARAIYRKLGVSSRLELGVLLHERPEE
jgi:DNA-binding NarL/FixJ family response regulator